MDMIKLNKEQKSKLINEVLGVRFKRKAESPKDGFTCWSLVKYVYKNYYNIDLPDYYSSICNNPLDDNYVKEKFNKYKNDNIWVEIFNLEEPCIILMKNCSKYINHAGVYIGDNQFLHCVYKTGVILTKCNDKLWKNKFCGFYKFIG